MNDVKRRQLLEAAVAASPYGRRLGVLLDSVERDRVRVRLPFDPGNVTFGDTVHGGAIASLIDIAAVAAAWSGVDDVAGRKGATLGISLAYLAPARGKDLVACAVIRRRGRTVSFCDVEVETQPDGECVATAQVTYHMSEAKPAPQPDA